MAENEAPESPSVAPTGEGDLVSAWRAEADALEKEANRIWDDDAKIRVRMLRRCADELAARAATPVAVTDQKERRVSPECWRDKHDLCECSWLICHCDCHRTAVAEDEQGFQYRECRMFKEREFHDWRWLGWPLTSPACEERWCGVCGLRKQPVNGKWANRDYVFPNGKGYSLSPTTQSSEVARAAQEIVDIAHRDRMQVPHRDTIAAIITKHLRLNG